MIPVDIEPHPQLPEGTIKVVYGADQTDDYIPLQTLKTPDGKVVTVWTFI